MNWTRLWYTILFSNIFAFPHTATADGSYQTGNSLLAACIAADHQVCVGYLMAISDEMDAGNSINGYVACLPAQVVTGQLKDIVVQFLYRNAAKRHLAAVGLAAEAFAESYPCR